MGLCVCVAVKSYLTSGASVRPENTVTYSACNGGQKNCGFFSETTLLHRSSATSVEGHSKVLWKAHMRNIVFTMWYWCAKGSILQYIPCGSTEHPSYTYVCCTASHCHSVVLAISCSQLVYVQCMYYIKHAQ